MEKEEKKMVCLLSFLILAAVSSFSTASNLLSQKFYFRTSAYVTGYAEKWKAASATQCAAQCLQKSTCDSYTYSRSTRDCYVQAETRQPEEGDDSSAHVKLYSTVCKCLSPLLAWQIYVCSLLIQTSDLSTHGTQV